MKSQKDNTVFFLGAGFSKAAGAPLQSDLLGKVLDYEGHNYNNPISDYKERLNSFLEDAFNLDVTRRRTFSLEDFYTPIDKCINDRISFRGYSVEYIQQIRNELSILIGIVLDNELIRSQKDKRFLDVFCEYIIAKSKGSRNKKKYSIITTNWDILLDRRIFELLSTNGREVKKPSTIDHGTHVTGLGDDWYEQVIPAMTAISKGGYTVKLFKIHGSLNWLKCPSCDRLYVNPLLKSGILDNELGIDCRICDRHINMPDGVSGGISLQPQIIYPTFLKELQTSHFTNIWNSVSRELSKTKRLVFIGYSFPQADFEIRQLLARKLPSDCEIINVGFSPEMNEDDTGYWTSAQSRYKSFFGSRAYTYYDCGASDFIYNHLKEL